MKLLIVDDQPTNRKLLRAQLEAEGHAVLEAADGVEALRVLENKSVDAIISDILMPNMDGFRLCREIRKRDKFSPLPFILYAITYDSPKDRELAQSVGADNYFAKPTPVRVILEAVREAAQKKHETSRPAFAKPDEAYVLKQYSEALVYKLEDKNIELNETLKKLQTAQEQVLELNRSLESGILQRTAELRESREQFRAVSETANDAIVSADENGNITYFNQAASKIFGYAVDEAIGQPLTLLMPERFYDAHRSGLARYLSTGEARVIGRTTALTGRRKDEAEFPMELSLASWRSGDMTFFSGTIRDITKRKHIENMLQEKNVELENAIKTKDRFLASMSHELRTPMNAIIGFTGTLLMGLPGPLTTDQEKQLRTVQANAKHLLALINDLLDLAKIEAGKVDLHLEPTDCKAVVEEVVATLRPQAEDKGLALQVTLPNQALTISADRRALSQIIINLANNAIKFTERGGVHLKVSPSEANGKRMVEFSVEDTGIGIRPEDQVKLFAAFTQVHQARRSREGSGLGLHLSQKLAELLGGKITFRSEYGKGSTFTLALTEA